MHQVQVRIDRNFLRFTAFARAKPVSFRFMVVAVEGDVFRLRMASRAGWPAVNPGRQHRSHKHAVVLAVALRNGLPAAFARWHGCRWAVVWDRSESCHAVRPHSFVRRRFPCWHGSCCVLLFVVNACQATCCLPDGCEHSGERSPVAAHQYQVPSSARQCHACGCSLSCWSRNVLTTCYAARQAPAI